MDWIKLLLPEKIATTETDYKESVTLNYEEDDRSLFKKDFDTICNSACVRRLQDKAQVFPLERGDFSRTRLTHSIEVMSIAESLGLKAISIIRSREKNTQPEFIQSINEIPTILSSAALLHDIGNPPFGHISEDVISEWFNENIQRLSLKGNKLYCDDLPHPSETKLNKILLKEHLEDLYRFDGNAQVLRIATHLQNSLGNKGMNLTYPVLATIIKYPDKYVSQQGKYMRDRKRGYFYTEKDIYQDIQAKLELNDNRHPLAFLLEASDDISYLISDLEDACKKGLISINDIKNLLKPIECHEKIKSLLVKIKTIEDMAKRNKKENSIIIQQIRVLLKGCLLIDASNTFAKKYDEIMAGSYYGELLADGQMKDLIKGLKELFKSKVYYCPEIVKTKIEACSIVKKLLETFILSAFNQANNGNNDDPFSLIYSMFSVNYRAACDKVINKFKNNNNSKELTREEKANRLISNTSYYKLVLARDILVGMTDTFAVDFYKNIIAIVQT